jgi:hypothetical protein
MKACAQQGDPMNVAQILKQRNALPESQIATLSQNAGYAKLDGDRNLDDGDSPSNGSGGSKDGILLH